MQSIAPEQNWSGDLSDEKSFSERLLKAMEENRIEAAVESVRKLTKRHAYMIAWAFVDLQRRVLDQPGGDAHDQSIAPLSRLANLLAAPYSSDLVEILFEVSIRLRDAGFHHRNLEYLEDLSKHFEAKRDLVNLGRTWIWKGRTFTDLGNDDQDLHCYWRALSLFQHVFQSEDIAEPVRHQAALGLSDVQHQMAVKCLNARDHKNSLLYNYRALAVRDKLKDDLRRSSSLANMALSYEGAENYGMALLHYLRAIVLDIHSSPGAARELTYVALGDLAKALGEPGPARASYEKGLSFGFRGFAALRAHSQSLLVDERYEDAIAELEEILSGRSRISTGVRLQSQMLLLSAYEKLGRETDAIRCRDETIDSLLEAGFLGVVNDAALAERIRSRLGQLGPQDHAARVVFHVALEEPEAARAALLQGLKMSQDGPAALHDRLRKYQAQLEDAASQDNSDKPTPATPMNDDPTFICRACQQHCKNSPAADERGIEQGQFASFRPDELCPDCRTALVLEQNVVAIPAGRVALSEAERVSVAAFGIDRFPVTNRFFRLFHKVMKRERAPQSWDHALCRHPEQPVACVTLDDCKAFCDWRSRLTMRRYRLPTQREWYRAALGDDGRTFPWGNAPPDHTRAAYALGTDFDAVPAPVGLFPEGASPFGVQDMAGNVAEWTTSLDEHGGPIFLGGSCATGPEYLDPKNLLLLAMYPVQPDTDDDYHLGFRCVTEDV